MNPSRLHEQSALRLAQDRPSGPFDELRVPSLSRDFDYGLFRPSLRANLEQGAKHRVETYEKAILLSCRRLFTKPKAS